MKIEKITISYSEAINVPRNVRMTISEIADLFGIYYQTAKRTIRAIEKSGVAEGDYSMTCIVGRQGVTPYYDGLEMVIAVAFHVHSGKTKMFRRWACRRATQTSVNTGIILLTQNTTLN